MRRSWKYYFYPNNGDFSHGSSQIFTADSFLGSMSINISHQSITNYKYINLYVGIDQVLSNYKELPSLTTTNIKFRESETSDVCLDYPVPITAITDYWESSSTISRYLSLYVSIYIYIYIYIYINLIIFYISIKL
jgi:hypothetical protein